MIAEEEKRLEDKKVLEERPHPNLRLNDFAIAQAVYEENRIEIKSYKHKKVHFELTLPLIDLYEIAVTVFNLSY